MTDQLPSGMLKELLTDYAEQARPYQVREAALRRGRRARQLHRVAPVAATVAVLGTFGALAATHLMPGHAPTPEQRTATTAWPVPGAAHLPTLPNALVDDPDPASLPTDAAVGPGLLVDVIAGDGHRLITPDGTHYRLDPPGTTQDLTAYALSPGGRWLTARPHDSAQTTVRDLTTTAVHDLAGEVLAWSGDGRWLLLGGPYPAAPLGADPIPANPGVVSLADLATSPPATIEVDLSACTRCAVVGVRADGDIVLAPLDGELTELVVADRATGALRPIEIDLSHHASTDELAGAVELESLIASIVPGNPTLAPDGTALLVLRRADGADPPLTDSDILVLDLDQARVLGRWDLPEPAPVGDGEWESWALAKVGAVPGVYAEGLLLTHYVAQRPVALELYDPVTGTLTSLTDLSGLSTPVG